MNEEFPSEEKVDREVLVNLIKEKGIGDPEVIELTRSWRLSQENSRLENKTVYGNMLTDLEYLQICVDAGCLESVAEELQIMDTPKLEEFEGVRILLENVLQACQLGQEERASRLLREAQDELKK